MNITLHKAADDLREILDQIDPETGELSEDFEQARAIVATKAVAVTAYLLENEKQADMVEEYAKDLLLRVKAQRKRSEWLRGYLASHMAACGITRIADERGLFSASLSIGRDESVDVFDQAQLPADLLRVIPVKYEPDKALIKKAIKSGVDVPGARLVLRDRLSIK